MSVQSSIFLVNLNSESLPCLNISSICPLMSKETLFPGVFGVKGFGRIWGDETAVTGVRGKTTNKNTFDSQVYFITQTNYQIEFIFIQKRKKN